jgi:heme oxygenase (mycobilin-producing)
MAVTLISAFEVPPDADEPFIAEWERAATEGFTAPALHRALRADVDFRFVSVARVESPEAAAAIPGANMPFKAHPGLYEVVYEDGAPDGEGGVVLINVFEVPAESDEPFVAGWNRARDLLAHQRGYLGTRLHRSPQADFRFVNIARWSSPLMFSRAVQRPEFAQAAMPFRSHPGLYQVIRR